MKVKLWIELTKGNKIFGYFMGVFFLIIGFFLLWVAPSLSDIIGFLMIEAIGVYFIYSSVKGFWITPTYKNVIKFRRWEDEQN